jgi:hypothetical protein
MPDLDRAPTHSASNFDEHETMRRAQQIAKETEEKVESHNFWAEQVHEWQEQFRRNREEPTRSGKLADFIISSAFEKFTALVILVNVIFAALAANWEIANIGKTPPVYMQLVEIVFLVIYSVELMMRLAVHGKFFFCNLNMKWNLFDFTLVIFTIFDLLVALILAEGGQQGGNFNISYMRMLRLLKLVKILRTLRVIKLFRDLTQIVDSLTSCMAAFMWAAVMMILVVYIFALIFMQALTSYLQDAGITEDDDVTENFGGTFVSMVSLYMAVTGGNDWGVYYQVVAKAGVAYEILFLFFTFFLIFALFNILIGVFVEKAVVATQPDRQELIVQQHRRSYEESLEFRHLLMVIDTNHKGKLTKEEFVAAMGNDIMRTSMQVMGLTCNDPVWFFDVIANWAGTEDIPIDLFVDGCMAMKGNASSLDMQRQLFEVKATFDMISQTGFEQQKQMDYVIEKLHACAGIP